MKPVIAPCGCRFFTEGEKFVLQACPKGEACVIVRYVEAETTRQGKPFSVREMP